ncbi:MAG: hypothetical protein M3O70_14920 [Actinomycetota bacterium]|nr:hypothetical protein [Actinomycetota bacterium]
MTASRPCSNRLVPVAHELLAQFFVGHGEVEALALAVGVDGDGGITARSWSRA